MQLVNNTRIKKKKKGRIEWKYIYRKTIKSTFQFEQVLIHFVECQSYILILMAHTA
jgi:hypothetical protein